MTLIVMVPAKGAAVVASDSRLTLNSGFCDGMQKLIELTRPSHSILYVSGRRGFWAVEPASLPDPCAYAASHARELDIGFVAREFVEAAGTDIDGIDLNALGKQCATAVVEYLHQKMLMLATTGYLTTVTLTAYDPSRSLAIYRSVDFSYVLNAASGHRIDWRVNQDLRFALDDATEPMIVGEYDYFVQRVLPTFLDQPLRDSTREFWKSFPRFPSVRDTSRQTAMDVAIDIVEAASRATLQNPAASGIGGPIIVRVLGA
jgi:hypothetical protein